MEQDINILIEDYRQALIDITNKSNLPIGVIRYIFENINNSITAEYNHYIQQKTKQMNDEVQQKMAEALMGGIGNSDAQEDTEDEIIKED